jgi:nucleoside phosphorylase
LKILVTFALENEFAPWRRLRNFRPVKWGTGKVFSAEIGNAEVGVLLTGVGPRQAVSRASQVIGAETDSINLCVSSGLAGALRPEYRIGQVLGARKVYSDEPGADVKTNTLESSNALLSFAEECGATIADRFHTTQWVVAKVGEKKLLSVKADAVEMESFEILRESAAFGIPAIAVRAVSDRSDENLPLENMEEILTDEGMLSIPRIIGQIAMNPQLLPGLMRLGQQSKAASEALAGFLDQFIASVSVRAGALTARVAAQP